MVKKWGCHTLWLKLNLICAKRSFHKSVTLENGVNLQLIQAHKSIESQTGEIRQTVVAQSSGRNNCYMLIYYGKLREGIFTSLKFKQIILLHHNMSSNTNYIVLYDYTLYHSMLYYTILY